MNSQDHIAVVGASAAGVAVVETLRKEGFQGSITLIGDEADLPYDRPPLSKQVLSGEWEPEKARLRETKFFDELGVDLRLGTRATSLDVHGRAISLEGGQSVGFDGLVIATGMRPRALPGTNGFGGVFTLRTIADAQAIANALTASERVAIVGAGFLGLEIAAVARAAGKDVTVIDTMTLPMLRPFGAPLAHAGRDLHASKGVDLRLGTSIVSIKSEGDRIAAVDLSDATVVPVDLVIAAIGAQPNVEWLHGSGLPIGNGVECDPFCAAAPNIFAAGDIANWENPLFAARMRLENRLNATEQARAAAENLLGRQQPYAPVPYYWTHQYEVNIQAFGVFPEESEFVVVAGDLNEFKFLACYVHQGRVVGALGSRMAGRMRQSRAVIQDQLTIEHARRVLT